MRSQLAIAGVGLIGCALSFALGRASVETQDAPAPIVAPPAPAVAPPPPVASPRPTAAEPEDCEPALEALRTENAFLQAQVTALGGTFSQWPEDSAFDEASIQRWLDTFLLESEGTLEFLDCDEFPCIVVLELPEGRASSSIVQPLAQRFAEDQGVPAPGVSVVGIDDRAFGLVPLGPELEPGSEAERRLPTRLDELQDALFNEAPSAP